MKTCMYIFRHEINKILGDRKLLGSIIFLPLVIVFVTSFLSGSATKTEAQKCRIYALDYVWAEQTTNQFEVVPLGQKTIEELLKTVELNPEDVVLQRNDDEAVIFFNSTNAASVGLCNLCRQMMYDQVLADFAAVNMVDVSERIVLEDLNANNDRGSSLMAIMLPYMLVLLLFQSASEYATDMIAGEKERGVFSKILLTPHSPTPIICGKLLSSTLCGTVSSAVYMLIVAGVSWITGVDSYGLLAADITTAELALLILCAILLSCLFASIAVLCSLYAKDVKEARTMRLPVYGITMVLALLAMLRTGTVSSAYYAVPIYNICLVMQDILSVGVESTQMLITVLSLSVCTAAVAAVTVLSFKKEEVRC